MNSVDYELRKLMDLYSERFISLNKQKRSCIDDEEEIVLDGLIRQCKIMTAELFQTMKKLRLLDEEEIEIGAIKNKY